MYTLVLKTSFCSLGCNSNLLHYVVLCALQAVCDRNPEMVVLNAIPSGLGRHQASPPPSTDEENQGE